MLQRRLVAPQLRQHRAHVQVRVRRVFHLIAAEAGLDLERLLQVAQRRVQLALAPVVARQVVVRHRTPGRVALRQNVRLLQQLQHHGKVLCAWQRTAKGGEGQHGAHATVAARCRARAHAPCCRYVMASRLHISPTVLHARHTSSESAPKKCWRSTSPRSMHSSASRYLPSCCSFTLVSSMRCSASSSASSSSAACHVHEEGGSGRGSSGRT